MAGTTFYKRNLMQFKTRAIDLLQHGINWYRRSQSKVHDLNRAVLDWGDEHHGPVVISIGLVASIGFTILFFRYPIDNVSKGGSIIFALGYGLFAGIILANLAYYLLWLLDRILLGIIYFVLFTPILIGAVFYGVYLVLLVVSQFLLLMPLTFLVFMSRLWLLWRRIFYTCPNRECSFRGLPIHICPTCGRNHEKLWSNIYGLIYHHCDCGKRLPTLDLLGRKHLGRLCAACKIQLTDNIGKLPEKLVALVGGPSVGKTNFLLMSTQRMLNGKSCETGNNGIKAELIVPAQKKELILGIENLENGIPPGKTQRTHKMAYLLRLNGQSRNSLLYYYDAAGEEYSTINRTGRQKNIKHLDGLILLVDPFSLEGLINKVNEEDTGLRASETPWGDVVSSTIATIRRIHSGNNGRKSIPLAVVITKADAQSVKEMLGDVKKKLPGSEQCEKALVRWGARNSVELLRQHFDTLRFFACSALGRSPGRNNRKSFRDYGIMEPLQWILNA